MLTFQRRSRGHFGWGQFHRNRSKYHSLQIVWKLHIRKSWYIFWGPKSQTYSPVYSCHTLTWGLNIINRNQGILDLLNLLANAKKSHETLCLWSLNSSSLNTLDRFKEGPCRLVPRGRVLSQLYLTDGKRRAVTQCWLHNCWLRCHDNNKWLPNVNKDAFF